MCRSYEIFCIFLLPRVHTAGVLLGGWSPAARRQQFHGSQSRIVRHCYTSIRRRTPVRRRRGRCGRRHRRGSPHPAHRRRLRGDGSPRAERGPRGSGRGKTGAGRTPPGHLHPAHVLRRPLRPLRGRGAPSRENCGRFGGPADGDENREPVGAADRSKDSELNQRGRLLRQQDECTVEANVHAKQANVSCRDCCGTGLSAFRSSLLS